MGRGLLPSVSSPANPLADITELSHFGSHRLAETVLEMHVQGGIPVSGHVHLCIPSFSARTALT